MDTASITQLALDIASDVDIARQAATIIVWAPLAFFLGLMIFHMIKKALR